MKILLAGDTHMNRYHADYLSMIAKDNEIETVVQLGDFGYWPRSHADDENFSEYVNEVARKSSQQWFWIDGNHEDFGTDLGKWVNQNSTVQVGTNLTYIPRGLALEWDGTRILFLGGANSIDREWRTPSVSWFEDELITQAQTDRALDAGRVDLMLTHDMPTVTFESQKGKARWILTDTLGRANRGVIQAVMENAQPKMLVHGHMHYDYKEIWRDIEIIGLNCHQSPDSWVIVEVQDGDVRKLRPNYPY